MVLKKTFFDEVGSFERELTEDEIQRAAKSGDIVAKRSILSEKIKKATGYREEIDAILDFLGVE